MYRPSSSASHRGLSPGTPASPKIAEARQSSPPNRVGRSKMGYVAGTPESPKAFVSQPTPSESSSRTAFASQPTPSESSSSTASKDGASSGQSARDRVLWRFCGAAAGGKKQVESRDLVLSFLSSAMGDGYISQEEHEELAKAVADLSSEFQKESSSTAEAMEMLNSTPMAAFFLRPTGDAPGQCPDAPKVRGSFDGALPSTLLIQSGLDADAILSDRTFNCRNRGDIPLGAALIAHGFQHPVNYASRYNMDVRRLDAWLEAVARQYTDTAYHNWMHAIDTFQLCFLSLRGGLDRYINYQDACSILIAAIAHDIGHQGQNNAFHLKARTQLAIVYNDKSPLENMHASLAFETLRKPKTNFLESLPAADFANMRMKIIDSILETDATLHFDYVAKLESRAQHIGKYVSGASKDPEQGKQATADRRLLVKGVVHMADIGNGFRTWDVYKHLVAALEEEFFLQGDQEQELGIPISPMMDRNKDSLAAGQDFFLTKMVLPLFDLYSNFMAEDFNNFCRSTLHANNSRWTALINVHGKKTVKEFLALDGTEEKKRKLCE